MATVRRKSGNFHSMSRALSQNETLSAESVGVMAYLLSKPDNWEAQLSDIERRFKIGKEKRLRIIRELENEGYLERVETRVDGRFDYQILVHETPLPPAKRTKETSRRAESNDPVSDLPYAGNPSTVKPPTAEPSTENPSTYIRTDIDKTDLQKTEKKETDLGASAPPAEDSETPPVLAKGKTPKPRDPSLDNEAVITYRDNFKLTPNPEQRKAIVDAVRDLECWRKTIDLWRLNKSDPLKIGNLLSAYQRELEFKVKRAGGVVLTDSGSLTVPDGFIKVNAGGMSWVMPVPESLKARMAN